MVGGQASQETLAEEHVLLGQCKRTLQEPAASAPTDSDSDYVPTQYVPTDRASVPDTDTSPAWLIFLPPSLGGSGPPLKHAKVKDDVGNFCLLLKALNMLRRI